jgi:UDP-GlcNAc:undecaprenyl-phosphate/decaprenyl-phosphate GlcNAc-1-phosphate transferase
LTLVAIHNENFEVAVLAVALAGSLAGFLLFNWHPACIFLGDSGSLLIGLLIGVIGVQGSMEGPSAISILFPILAMGLPISDTAMAIFRRWVRNLPLSAADRRHVHHLLIGLGLNPRQAALLLYCFSAFLCGVVMLGVALRNEYLTLILGISGCLVFLLVVTSRRDELTNLRDDLQDRLTRGRQERQAAKLTWEAIQRIELSKSAAAANAIVEHAALTLGSSQIEITVTGDLSAATPAKLRPSSDLADGEAGTLATFRVSGGDGIWITVSARIPGDSALAADIVFRSLHRLGQAISDWHAAARQSELELAEAANQIEAVESRRRDREFHSGLRGVGLINYVTARLLRRREETSVLAVAPPRGRGGEPLTNPGGPVGR